MKDSALTTTESRGGAVVRIETRGDYEFRFTNGAIINTGDRIQSEFFTILGTAFATTNGWFRLAKVSALTPSVYAEPTPTGFYRKSELAATFESFRKIAELRYTFNGPISTGQTKDAIISTIEDSFNAILNFDDKVRLAGETIGSTTPIRYNQDNMLDVISFKPKLDPDNKVNVINGSFNSPAENHKMAPYPTVRDELSIAGIGELETKFDFPYTNSPSMVQRLTRNKMRVINEEGVVDFDTYLDGYNHTIGDPIYIDVPYQTDSYTGLI